MSCTVSDRTLHALVTNGLSAAEAAAVRDHASSCPRCAPVLQQATVAIAVLRDLEVALPDSLQQTREISTALAARQQEHRPWRWMSLVLAGTALVLVLFGLLWRTRAPAPQPPPQIAAAPPTVQPSDQLPVRLIRGTLAEPIALAVDERVTADATLELADGSRVTAQRESRFIVRTLHRWEVTRGQLHFAMQKQQEAFVVTTPEVSATVIGTQFTVERDNGVTQITVQEGRVRVEAGAATQILEAGDVWPTEPLQKPPSRASEPHFDAAKIRARITAGKTSEARALIAASAKSFANSMSVLAELGVLSAEADLAERKYRPALDKYLAVVRDFPSTAQAEQALFAAAQLTFDEPAAGYQPTRLLRDYLETYPHGRFHSDAERLLRSVEK